VAITFAFLSSLCFGIGHVSASVGLRTLDPRSGAAISIPAATLLFAAAAPFALDLSQVSATAAILFALVGLFFPAAVTLLNFRSNELLGPTVTSTVSGTTPLFALVAAALLLGEKIPSHAAAAALGVLIGIALLSWHPGGVRRFSGWSLGWPFLGAVVRALAQVGAERRRCSSGPTRSREPDRLRRLVGHGGERGPAAALTKDESHAAEFRLVRDHRGAQRRRGCS